MRGVSSRRSGGFSILFSQPLRLRGSLKPVVFRLALVHAIHRIPLTDPRKHRISLSELHVHYSD